MTSVSWKSLQMLSFCLQLAEGVERIRMHTEETWFVYSLAELEESRTHDDLWNSAQLQLAKQGKMHGFLRMYWAKKILEWTESPEQALKFALYLNDRYSLDGRDPSGYVGKFHFYGDLWLESLISCDFYQFFDFLDSRKKTKKTLFVGKVPIVTSMLTCVLVLLISGCMWSICGIHDQGWGERPVFGKIRYMNYQGCKRKFDVSLFVKKWGGKIHRKAKS